MRQVSSQLEQVPAGNQRPISQSPTAARAGPADVPITNQNNIQTGVERESSVSNSFLSGGFLIGGADQQGGTTVGVPSSPLACKYTPQEQQGILSNALQGTDQAISWTQLQQQQLQQQHQLQQQCHQASNEQHQSPSFSGHS